MKSIRFLTLLLFFTLSICTLTARTPETYDRLMHGYSSLPAMKSQLNTNFGGSDNANQTLTFKYSAPRTSSEQSYITETSESYDQLMRRYYSTPAMRKLFNTPPDRLNYNEDSTELTYSRTVSITGKFDGVHEDRLTLFPVAASATSEYSSTYYG